MFRPMISPLSLPCRAFVAAVFGCVVLPWVGLADDLTPPVVAKPIANLTVAAGTTQSVINLKKTFGLSGVTGQVVRMATVVGNIDLEMLADDAPLNVANFLGYVNSGYYNGTFIHRSVPGFVLQGGRYYVSGSNQVAERTPGAAVKGEHKVSNTRGTLALALSTGPDSGSDQWFFNLVDNNGVAAGSTNLDTTADGGPFTVFARVIEGDLATMDAIAALPESDFSSSLGNAFTNLPLYNFDSTMGASVSNLVYLNDVAVIPLVPPSVGADAVLKLKAKNNNLGLVTAVVTGRKLKLAFAPGKTGSARIKIVATDSTGAQATAKFTVTVQ